MESRWYVVRTKPRSEFLAANELARNHSVEVYSPLVKSATTRNGSDVAPLFPGYVLIKINPETARWPQFGMEQHALGFVNFDGDVPWLPDEAVVELKQRCDSINQVGGLWRRYQPGDWVSVVTSNMQGAAQVVDDGRSVKTPVRILLQLFGRLVPAKVPRQSLQPLESHHDKEARAPRRTRGRGRWTKEFRSNVSGIA